MIEEDITFLNHADGTAPLKVALESQRQWAEYIEKHPKEFMDRDLVPNMVHILRHFADMLECRPEELMPVTGQKAAMEWLVRSWVNKKVADGCSEKLSTVILSTTSPLTKSLLESLADEGRLTIEETEVTIPAQDEHSVLEPFESTLTPETSLVILESLPSDIPFAVPFEEAIGLVREVCPQAFVILDATQGFAALPMTLRQHPADAVIASCGYWFSGPRNSGFLHFPLKKREKFVDPSAYKGLTGAEGDEDFQVPGPIDFSSFLALDAVLEFWDRATMPTPVYGQYLAIDAAEILMASWGSDVGVDYPLMGPMALMKLPSFQAFEGQSLTEEHRSQVRTALKNRSIDVCISLHEGDLYVRISCHLYNHGEEFEELQNVVLELAQLDSLQ